MTSMREALIETFLETAGWADAGRTSVAGDASNRRYLRLERDNAGQSAILMDSPLERGEDVRPFIKVDEYLFERGFSAPEIISRNVEHGLLLLEDLGDDLFARVIERNGVPEELLYTEATDLLVRLHDLEPPDLPPYDAVAATDLAMLAYDWYLPVGTGSDEGESGEFFGETMRRALSRHAPECDVTILRDYHAENLIWLKEREGIARVGLLDFQDANLGHRSYDLVSLLQDARRDVPEEIEDLMMARYIRATGQDREDFYAAYNCIGAQRNLRIVGIFTRLCARDGKSHYIDLIPRVWDYLQRNLSHPAVKEIRDVVMSSLPEPTPEILNRIKGKCATYPAQ
ncbi:MAG: phosphotransferase [Roseovarius sp.]|nr:phosphotransferase [Roseovarius sp.]MCY4290809.1 phosphotransferase [Roseovarius sp.]